MSISTLPPGSFDIPVTLVATAMVRWVKGFGQIAFRIRTKRKKTGKRKRKNKAAPFKECQIYPQIAVNNV